jgi:hypothetical protein
MGRKARNKPGHKQTKGGGQTTGGGRPGHRHQTLKEDQLPQGLAPQHQGSTPSAARLRKTGNEELLGEATIKRGPTPAAPHRTTIKGALGPQTGEMSPEERSKLPAILQDLPEDSDVPVIIALDRDRTPPPGAGDYLGDLDVPVTTSEGVFPVGSPIWLDTSKVLGVPPGFVRQTTKGRIIVGGSSDADPDAPLPHGLQHGDIIATEQPLGFVETGIRLPDGSTIEPGAKVYRAESLAGLESTLQDGLNQYRTSAMSSGLIPKHRQRILSDNPARSRKPKRDAAGRDIIDADSIPGLMDRVRQVPGLEDKLRQGMSAEQLKETGPLIASLLSDVGYKGKKRNAVIQFSPQETLQFTQSSRKLTPTDVLEAHSTLAEEQKHPSQALLTYFESFMESVYAKAGNGREKVAAWQWLFYPAKDARDFIAILAKQLVDARTYQVTGDMMDAVTVVYDKMRQSKNLSWFEKDAVPAPAGFVWLDTPLTFIDAGGLRMTHRALSWSVVTVWQGRDHDEKHPHAHHKVGEVCDCPDATAHTAVRITTWTHRDDPDDFYHRTKLPPDVFDVLGELTMGHSVIIPFGQRFALPDMLKASDGSLADDLGRWTYVLFKFFSEELTVTRKELPARPARRRAMKSIKSGEVSVIILRKKRPMVDGAGGPGQPREWSCRWPVEGHYRHLEKYDLEIDELGRAHRHQALPYPWDKTHCVTCGSRITFVHPYLKGPTYLPVRQREQLYKLVR